MGAVAAVFVDGLLVKADLLAIVPYEGSCTEESLFVKDVDILVNESEKLVAGVILVFYVSDESCAAELRKNGALKGSVDLRHVLDLVLANCRIAIHRKDAEDKVLVLEVGVGYERLEAFPVLTYALELRIGDILALHDLVPCLVGRLRTLVGELVVEGFSAVRRSISYDLGAGDVPSGVSCDSVESCLEVLDGLVLELLAGNV